jgi:hypothetical protein
MRQHVKVENRLFQGDQPRIIMLNPDKRVAFVIS